MKLTMDLCKEWIDENVPPSMMGSTDLAMGAMIAGLSVVIDGMRLEINQLRERLAKLEADDGK